MDSFAKLVIALKELYVTPEYRNKILKVFEKYIIKAKKIPVILV